MIRTQVYLPEEQHQELHAIAQAKGQSLAEVMRSAHKLYIKNEKNKKKHAVKTLDLPSFSSGKKLGKLDRRAIYEDF